MESPVKARKLKKAMSRILKMAELTKGGERLAEVTRDQILVINARVRRRRAERRRQKKADRRRWWWA